ncbi:MAG TPA: nucleotide exchange factor GrpE [Myxococcota bacterium]|nr:nucleotide exchange factor GrpE [Myxococcota bacterium]
MNTEDAKPEVEAQVQSAEEAGGTGSAEAGAEAQPQAETQAGGEASPDEKVVQPSPDLRDMRIQMLERALAERENTLHSYIRAHKKAEAEFEAFKQRLERDRDRELTLARAKLVERLLDLDDNLERTISAAKRGTAEALPALVQGVEMVHKQFLERLSELGLERVDPTGQTFDPTSMEAFGVVPVDDRDRHDKVVATFRSGYRIGDQEIRPALVQVGRLMS